MSIDIKIEDGHGAGYKAKFDPDGAVHTVVHPHPPERIDANPILPTREFLTLGGDGSTTSMLVNGATTSQEFTLEADPLRSTYISTLSFLIIDAGAALQEFGNLAALSNGCDLEWSTSDLGTTTIGSGLTTNFSLVRLCGGQPAFGNTTGAFIASNVSGNSEGVFPVLSFEKVFGIRYGLRLRAGSNDKIIFRINDDVSTMDAFNVIAYGFKF